MAERIHRLEPRIYQFTYGVNEPALRVRSGDVVVARTRDARGLDEEMAPLPANMRQQIAGVQLSYANPLVGPIYVEGAEPGDMLAVRINRIRLTRENAWSSIGPHFGSLTGERQGMELFFNDPLPSVRFEWQLDLQRNVGMLALPQSRTKRVEIPLHPFLGCIGVAPRHGRVETSATPGEFGGNMDCVETKEGTTLYLSVWAPGAYLAFGDIHAAQGDGEICGTALEVSAEVELKLDVVKGKTADWPRLEDDDFIMTTGSTRPLMDAVRIAQVELVKWLVDGYGFDKWEALQVVSQAMVMRIGNVVDPNYTVVAKFPKKLLGI